MPEPRKHQVRKCLSQARTRRVGMALLLEQSRRGYAPLLHKIQGRQVAEDIIMELSWPRGITTLPYPQNQISVRPPSAVGCGPLFLCGEFHENQNRADGGCLVGNTAGRPCSKLRSAT